MKVIEISAKKNMLKLYNGQSSSWYKINDSNKESLAVASTLAVNDEVDVKATMINGVCVVSEIAKTDTPTKPLTVAPEVQEEQPIPERKIEVGKGNNFSKPTGYKCIKCGTPLKDDKYPTCYNCSMAAKATQPTKYGKTPEEQESIRKQAIGHMTSVTVAALVSQHKEYGVAEVLGLIDNIYDKYYEKVK